MMSLPLCEFQSSHIRNINKKNLDDNTHIGRLIIIYNYSNAPSIAHSVYRIDNIWERSGSVVECLTRDRGAAGPSLTGVAALCS